MFWKVTAHGCVASEWELWRKSGNKSTDFLNIFVAQNAIVDIIPALPSEGLKIAEIHFETHLETHFEIHFELIRL